MKWSSVAIWSGVGAVILVVLLLVAKESVTGGTDKPYSIGMTFRARRLTPAPLPGGTDRGRRPGCCRLLQAGKA